MAIKCSVSQFVTDGSDVPDVPAPDAPQHQKTLVNKLMPNASTCQASTSKEVSEPSKDYHSSEDSEYEDGEADMFSQDELLSVLDHDSWRTDTVTGSAMSAFSEQSKMKWKMMQSKWVVWSTINGMPEEFRLRLQIRLKECKLELTPEDYLKRQYEIKTYRVLRQGEIHNLLFHYFSILFNTFF